MISEAEIRRNAARMKVDPMVIDLDYSLGWFLLGLSKNDDLRAGLRFKGGTCLRKCYFPEYRFSEDLDFTMEKFLSASAIETYFQQIASWVTEQNGPNFQVEPIRFEVIDDEYGSESYQARVYYRGPLQWGGSPRTIRIDVTRYEKLLLSPATQPIHHPYSDQGLFQGAELICYALEEVMAEKLRAVGGQRRFAVSRDVYDISNLRRAGVDMQKVKTVLPLKFQARGIPLSQISIGKFESRKSEFLQDWNRRLSYLVQGGQDDFEIAWANVLQTLHEGLEDEHPN
jgi:predicted nucleotidyltransferase component of viral defense system